MKNAFLKVFLMTLFGMSMVLAETVVLQNGDDYDGCKDTYLSDDDGQDGQNTNFGDKTMCSLQGYH